MRRNGEHFVTCGQMKVLEKRADEDGLSYYQMMENAGTCAAKTIMEAVAYDKVMTSVAEGTAGRPEKAVAERTRKAENFANTGKSPNNDAYKVKQSAAKGAAAIAGGRKTGGGMSAAGGNIKIMIEKAKKVFVFCGKGNNGGDGFVVARLLSKAGFFVRVVLVDGLPKTDDAVTNFELLKDLPVSIVDMAADDRALLDLREKPDMVVDAIYGTGFHGKLKGNGLKAAMYINSLRTRAETAGRTKVFALDIPSGLGGDLVDEEGMDVNTIKAHHTITFHAKKPVHLQKFAAEYCGKITVADIGIDEERLWEVDY